MTNRPVRTARPLNQCPHSLTSSSTQSPSHGSLGVYASGVSQTISESIVDSTTSEPFGIFVAIAAAAAAASASSAVAVGKPSGDLEAGLRRHARRPDRPRQAAAAGRLWRPRMARAGMGARPVARTSRLDRRRMAAVASAASQSLRMWDPRAPAARMPRGRWRLGDGGRW